MSNAEHLKFSHKLNDSFDLHLQKYQGKHQIRSYNKMAEIVKKGNNS